MTERQSKFLKDIIESYTVNAQPVASGYLAKKADVSSATIRNEMSELEEHGFIVQPHTSAGRIPTVKGYQFYLKNYLKPKAPSTAQKKILESALKDEQAVKAVAKQMSEISGQAVLVAFARNNYYYTGISNLFSQPEFHDPNAVVNISVVLDALDETLGQLYEEVGDDVSILLGKDNPFSAQCSLVISQAPIEKNGGLMAILGPTRMDYNRSVGLLDFTKSLLTN